MSLFQVIFFAILSGFCWFAIFENKKEHICLQYKQQNRKSKHFEKYAFKMFTFLEFKSNNKFENNPWPREV